MMDSIMRARLREVTAEYQAGSEDTATAVVELIHKGFEGEELVREIELLVGWTDGGGLDTNDLFT